MSHNRDRVSHRRSLPLTAATLLTLAGLATTASAQANPELGLTGSAEASASADGASANSEGESSLADGDASAPDDDPETSAVAGDSDHDAVVGTFGVGFFGVERLPLYLPGFDLMDCVTQPCEDGSTISAPTIGARYWLSDLIGIQAALGFHLASGEIASDAGNQDTLSTFGLALHGGVPLALASSGHFVFEVVPFMNLGFASGSVVDPTTPDNDLDLSGFLFELGGTVGAEIHFGFIDLPQLALQANVGLSLRLENRGVTTGGTETDWSTTRISTSADGDPWDIFLGNLAAIYYFR